MAKSFHYRVRKVHRYLGLILGIQFIFWTVGGIYFSWSNMDDIHGDLNRNPVPLIPAGQQFVSPSEVLLKLNTGAGVDSVKDIRLINILGRAFYQIHYLPGQASGIDHAGHSDKMPFKVQLADALNGQLRGPLKESEAVEIARSAFRGNAGVAEVRLLNETSSHHEYRSNPLPAYAVSFKHPSASTVFVSAELGTVQKIRNQKWRIFDFMWMLHTMDYQGRDNFGNFLLRAFSVFGLITIFSGFILYYVSSGKRKKRVSL